LAALSSGDRLNSLLPDNPLASAQVANAFKAAMEADELFQKELVRVYGERNAGDARYMQKHDDDAVQEAKENYVAASDALHRLQNGNAPTESVIRHHPPENPMPDRTYLAV